jgi:hypothetical protein
MNELMYEAIINYSRNITFSIHKQTLEAREYPYSRVFWMDLFQEDFDIESQTIDSNGKCRSYNLSVKKNPSIKFTIYIPPSQPIDAPEDFTVYETTYDIATSIFGTPTKEIKGGLWFKVLDYEHGIFIPCPTNSTEICPESPVPSADISANNPIINFRNAEKYSKMLIECIIWGLRSNGILNLQDYLDKYDKFIIVNENVRPNITPKNRSYLTEKGNFSYIHNIWNEYFTKDNKVQLYPELYDKVVRYLAIYYKDNDGLSLPPDPYLNGVFKYEWDFKTFDQNRIIIGEDNLKQWFKLKENIFSGELQINKELCKNKLDANNELPFIYEYEGNLYLVQNVRDGKFNRALNCGNEWNKNKLNNGYETADVKTAEFIPHIIYNVSDSLLLFLQDKEDDKRKGSMEFVSLIYVSGKYVAMLQL